MRYSGTDSPILSDYIEKYDTINNGYNVAKYGTGNKGVNFSASHRQKIGAASKGRTHTAATKQKISAANLGRTQSDATKQRISQGNTGKKRTPEMRKAQSDRMKGIEQKLLQRVPRSGERHMAVVIWETTKYLMQPEQI